MKSRQDLREPLLNESKSGDIVLQELPDDKSKALQVHPAAKVVLSERATQFLKRANLTLADLKTAGISQETLEKMLQKSHSGRVVRWLALEAWITKSALFLLLDERGIAHAEIPDQKGCRRALSAWCHSRAWPYATSLPFTSSLMLRRAYGVTNFMDGAEAIITRVWSVLLFTMLGIELYYYTTSPIARAITTLPQIFLRQSKNERSLVTFFTKPNATNQFALGTFIGLPIAWGIIEAMLGYCSVTQHNETQFQKKLKALEDYQTGFWIDVMAWGLPCNQTKRCIKDVTRTLIWDNRLTANQRIELWNAFARFFPRTRKITQLYAISALSRIANSIARYDFARLANRGIEPAVIASFLFAKTEALKMLRSLIAYASPHVKGKIARRINPLPRYLAVHYFLWVLGQSHYTLLSLLFWGWSGFKLSSKILFALTVYQGIKAAIEQYGNEKDCQARGMQWTYLERAADFYCTFCGDEPYYRRVYYKNLFTAQDCIRDFLSRPQTKALNTSDIVKLFQRVKPSDNITMLDFSQQDLSDETGLLPTVLPVLQTQLPTLKTLWLNATQTGTIGLHSTEAAARLLTRVKVTNLVLSKQGLGINRTCIIAQALPDSAIEIIDLSWNIIGNAGTQGLAAALPESKVTWLDLHANMLDDNDAQALAAALPASKVTMLDLADNDIGVNGTQALAAVLPASKVTTLNLVGNAIGENGAQALAAALPASKVVELGLSSNQIGDNGVQALAQGLSASKITMLKLGTNKIGINGIQALAAALPASQITLLELEGNAIDADGTQALAAALPASNVTVLILEFNKFGDKGTQALAAVLPLSRVAVLNLSGNGISVNGVQALAAVLATSKVTSLYLGDNDMGVYGIQALAAALPASMVTKLSLNGNRIDVSGAQALAAALPASMVTELSLGSNDIGADGAQALASALPASKVSSLKLWSNKIGNNGIQALAVALPTSKMTLLDLAFNDIGISGAQAFAPALPASKVVALDLFGNQIADRGAKAFAEILTKTPGVYVDFLNQLNPDIRQATVQAEPNTQLAFLDLRDNRINTTGAIELCRVLPQTSISLHDPSSFNLPILDSNPIDPNIVDISTCNIFTSTAYEKPIPWPYRITGQIYRYSAEQLGNFYQGMRNVFERRTSSVGSEKPTATWTKSTLSVHAIIKQNVVGTVYQPAVLPTPENATPARVFTVPALSTNDKLIAAHWGFHYLREAVNVVAEYSPFTLPWNRAKKLSAEMQQQLEVHEKQLHDYEKLFATQQKSRAGKNPFFKDKYQQLQNQLNVTKQKMNDTLKAQKISSGDLKFIAQNLSRIENNIHQLADINKQLKHSYVKVRRALSRAAHKKEQVVVTTQHNSVNNTCSEKALRLNTHGNWSMFGALQQFWSRDVSASSHMLSMASASSNSSTDYLPSQPMITGMIAR